MFEIRFTTEALEDLRVLRKADQKRAVDGIETHLAYEPSGDSRNRKRLPEIEWARKDPDLMRFLDERASQPAVLSLEEVKAALGIG